MYFVFSLRALNQTGRVTDHKPPQRQTTTTTTPGPTKPHDNAMNYCQSAASASLYPRRNETGLVLGSRGARYAVRLACGTRRVLCGFSVIRLVH